MRAELRNAIVLEVVVVESKARDILAAQGGRGGLREEAVAQLCRRSGENGDGLIFVGKAESKLLTVQWTAS